MSITTCSLSNISSDCATLFNSRSHPTAPSIVHPQLWHQKPIYLSDKGTHYGFIWQGEAVLNRAQQASPMPLQGGMYFSLAESATITGESAAGIIITHLTHRGQFLLGGPVASTGRLPYIDGGTTNLLVPPIAAGDPCLSALYMPANVNQTVHEHPSDRIGIILRGSGYCTADNNQQKPLQPGTLFYISAHQPHRFLTGPSGLDLVVFHPDSDMGVTHRNHPMLRRTLVEGTSAVDLPQIQTPL